MHDTFERLGTSDVRIQVSIPWSELEGPYRDSLTKLRSSIQVRGFRQGKAPAGFVEKMVGPALVQEVAAEKVSQAVEAILQREKIVPLRLPLDVASGVKVDGDRTALWDAEIDVLPMIGPIEFDGLAITPRKQIGDEDVDGRLRIMGARKAPFETAPSGHTIGQYDKVTLTGKARIGDDEAQVKEVNDLIVDLAPWGEAPPTLSAQLQGKKAGDEGAIELILPLGEGEGDQKLRLTHLDYKVVQIMTRRVPVIDEEFARDFDMESLEALRGEVRIILEKESYDEHVTHNGGALIEQLLERVKFDLPRKMQAAIDSMAAESETPDTAEGRELPRPVAKTEGGIEERPAMARYYERFTRRSVLSMLIAHQYSLTLPEKTMKAASERMRKLIDEQEGSREQKDKAFDNWKGEFEQSLFNHMLNLFLIQQVEKTLEPGGDETPAAASDGQGPEQGSQGNATP